MARLISWLIMVPVALVVIVFTIANRGVVKIDLWPLPLAPDIPVFSLALAAGFAGFLAGALIAWLSGSRRRARYRKIVRQLEAAKAEQAALKNRLGRLEQTQSSPLLAPPDTDQARADAA